MVEIEMLLWGWGPTVPGGECSKLVEKEYYKSVLMDNHFFWIFKMLISSAI